jgi:hypothetical protein
VRIYQVFARARRDEPLRQVGSVTADSLDLARVYAYKTYDEEPWIEMVLAPQDAFASVIDLHPALGHPSEVPNP